MLLFITTVDSVSEGYSRVKFKQHRGSVVNSLSCIPVSQGACEGDQCHHARSFLPEIFRPSTPSHSHPIHFPKHHKCRTDHGVVAAPYAPNMRSPTPAGLFPGCSLHYSRHPGSLHTPQVPQAAVPLSSTILPPVTQSLNPRRTSVSNLSPAAAIVYVCSLSACPGCLSNP